MLWLTEKLNERRIAIRCRVPVQGDLALGGHEKPPVGETWVHPGRSTEVHSPVPNYIYIYIYII